MPINLNPLENANRLLVESTLRVAAGTGGRFQPTRFPDLGPGLYSGVAYDEEKKKLYSVDRLLVESAQSMANRLEDACWDGEDYIEDCQGIPYVRVIDGMRNNEFLTTSVLEPHRLASSHVLGAKLNGQAYKDKLKSDWNVDKDRPVHQWQLAQRLFSIDPGCVIHGVFLDEIDGRLRLQRLISGYIEATDPKQANSGGVYRDVVSAKYNIPYSRQEFCSFDIKATFILHLGTFRTYRLSDDQRKFLICWALYKIDRFLRSSLRLRTACEFEVVDISALLDGRPWQWADSAVTGSSRSANPSRRDSTTPAWPPSEDIREAFLSVKNRVFPLKSDGDEWSKRNVLVLQHVVDIEGKAELPNKTIQEAIKLNGLTEKAAVKEIEKGRGKAKTKVLALVLTKEWTDEDKQRLRSLNPEETEDGGENPARKVVEEAIQDYEKNWEKKGTRGTKKAVDTNTEETNQ